MKPWLQGDFGTLEPKENMTALRDCVQKSSHRGVDLHAFWLGLAQIDPLACADLALGPKAIAHPFAVESSLVVLEHLEKVVAPSGLYGRMLSLAPSLRPKLATVAARRFPEDSWIWRIDVGDIRGVNVLKAHFDTPYFGGSCGQAARMGLTDALSQCLQGDRLEQVLHAVWRAVGPGLTIRLANEALQYHVPQVVLPFLGALLGPSMSEGIRVLWPTLKTSLSVSELDELQRSFALN